MCDLFISLFLKKKVRLIGFVLIILNFNFAYSQNCGAQLYVEKNRNAKSAYNNDPAIFNMVITNTASRSVTYHISTKNLTESCATENKKTTAPNVKLQTDIKLRINDLKEKSQNVLTLKAGETQTFEIHVSVPPSTPFNNWSCIEVSAKSDECNNQVANTILRVYVPNPSED